MPKKNANTVNFENELLRCPSTSFWLKEQLSLTKNRDPIDAYNDAHTLTMVLEQRIEKLHDG